MKRYVYIIVIVLASVIVNESSRPSKKLQIGFNIPSMKIKFPPMVLPSVKITAAIKQNNRPFVLRLPRISINAGGSAGGGWDDHWEEGHDDGGYDDHHGPDDAHHDGWDDGGSYEDHGDHGYQDKHDPGGHAYNGGAYGGGGGGDGGHAYKEHGGYHPGSPYENGQYIKINKKIKIQDNSYGGYGSHAPIYKKSGGGYGGYASGTGTYKSSLKQTTYVNKAAPEYGSATSTKYPANNPVSGGYGYSAPETVYYTSHEVYNTQPVDESYIQRSGNTGTHRNGGGNMGGSNYKTIGYSASNHMKVPQKSLRYIYGSKPSYATDNQSIRNKIQAQSQYY